MGSRVGERFWDCRVGGWAWASRGVFFGEIVRELLCVLVRLCHRLSVEVGLGRETSERCQQVDEWGRLASDEAPVEDALTR